ncbi:DNA-directed RNA polymerase subunit alpha, partial [candidate division WWE3 bacterium]|nr:DNA-directed RNA polymerase subunit alpha [candidate division WWE3 bacterium]
MPLLDTEVIINEKKDNYGKFTISPLDKGYGHTVGNALRRILLGSLNGASVTQVKFADASHEFTTIPGVKEDVVELVLALKKINFKMDKKQTTVVTLDITGPGTVTAGDIHCPAGIEVINKDLEIANLSDKNSVLKAELIVEYGRGYRLVEEKKTDVGAIFLDADFSPVKRVSYKVEDTRVGKLTDLDKLTLEIHTNGSFDCEEALKQAAAILVDQFALIAKGAEVERLESEKKVVKKEAPKQEKIIYLEELELPTRVLNTLRKAGLEKAEDVVERGEEGLMEIKN